MMQSARARTFSGYQINLEIKEVISDYLILIVVQKPIEYVHIKLL